MKRPKTHEIETLAERLFESTLPALWVVRKQSDDYGTDYEIEIFKNAKSTGVTFKAQLKGTEAPDFSEDGKFLTHQLRVDRARYLCWEMKVASILVIADVTRQRVYWTAPQLDRDLCDRLRRAIAGAQATLVIHVPATNVLPQGLDAMMHTVADAHICLGTRTVADCDIPRFVTATSVQFDSEALIGDLASKAAALKVERIRMLYHEGKPDEARQLLSDVLGTTDASAEVKLAALIETEKAENERLKAARAYHDSYARLHLRITSQMKAVIARGPTHLRLYAAVAYKAAELEMLAFHDWGMYLNWFANQSSGDAFWRLKLSRARHRTAMRLVRKYAQCIRLLNFAMRTKQHAVVSQVAVPVISALASFVLRLHKEGLLEAASGYRRSTRELANTAIDIAVSLEQWDDVGPVALSAFLIARLGDPPELCDYADWARKQLGRVADTAAREEYASLLEGYIDGSADEAAVVPTDRAALETQIYYNMATALGIDLGDLSDPTARIVAQGIADRNPERVLQHCRHLFVSLGASDPLASWLRLLTAAFKRLHCTLHSHGVEALSLDECLETMKETHCQGCPDVAPRDPSWHWTPDWQIEQNKLHAHFVRGPDRTSNG